MARPTRRAVAAKGEIVPSGTVLVKVGECVLGKKVYRKKGTSALNWRVDRGRVFEIEKIIRHRHRDFVDTDDAILYAEIAAPHLREATSIVNWIQHYCPGLNTSQIRKIVRDGSAPQRLPRADQVAKALGVTFAERQALDLRTIGACDVSAEQRRTIAAEKKREANRVREARRRRLNGAKPRERYVAESVAAEAKRLGVTRQAIYKRRKAVKQKDLSEKLTGACPNIHSLKGNMSTRTCQPAARRGGVGAATLGAIRAVQAIQASPQEVAASAANRGSPDWRAAAVEAARRAPADWRTSIVRRAQALIAAGIDPCADLDDPNIVRDGISAA